MTSRYGNWGGLLNEIRKEIKRPLSIHEDIQEYFPSYVDTYLTLSPRKADRKYPQVRRHVNKCRQCREELEELLEMAKEPTAQAFDAKPSPVPQFVTTPEPEVHKPKRETGNLLILLKDSLGEVLWQLEKTVELPSVVEAFRSAIAPERVQPDSRTEVFLQEVEDLVRRHWQQKEEEEGKETIEPAREACELFVKKVRNIPEVSHVYAISEQQLVHLWTVVDEFDPEICYPIYDIELEVADAFLDLEFDFNVLSQLEEEANTLLPAKAELLYDRH